MESEERKVHDPHAITHIGKFGSQDWQYICSDARVRRRCCQGSRELNRGGDIGVL